jgi:GNAT superfamily N-acetyltransferase
MTEAVVAAHEARLRELDPLLPRTHPLPELEPDETPISVEGGVGLARRIRWKPDEPASMWNPADQHRLVVRIGGADPAAAMDAVLARWRERVVAAAEPEDPDSSAFVMWPSRDVSMNRSFLDHGLVPFSVLAARPAGRSARDVSSAVRVRRLTETDLDAAVELSLVENRWGVECGRGTVRPAAAELIRRGYVDVLERAEPWTWVAEVDGHVVGLLTVPPREHVGWVGPSTSAKNPAYVGHTAVAASQRGEGVGAALVQHVHAALDQAGVDVILLNYSLLNPLSGPFWNRSGYRPLWTLWDVRPASRLR